MFVERQSKYWSEKNEAQIESYYTSIPGIKRSQWLVEQLKPLKFSSVCECGMFSGRNLKFIKTAFPHTEIFGFDVNGTAVSFSKSKIPEGKFWCMDIIDIAKCIKKFDLIFTSGTLIHIHPNELEYIINGMIKVSNKYILHIEEIGATSVVAGPAEFRPTYKISDQIQFRVDLLGIYKKLGFNPKVISLPEEVKTNGAKELVIVEV